MIVNRVTFSVLYTFLFLHVQQVSMAGNYWTERELLMQEDQSYSLGSSIVLTENELKANAILMKHKCDEIQEGFDHPEKFLAAQNFLKAKHDIDKSEVFKIIQKLPKGTSLHSHDMALTSGEYVYNLTYKPNLYASENNGHLRLRFFKPNYKDDNWTLVSKLRSSDPKFDDFLKSQLTLIVDDPEKEYPDINSVWIAFSNIFTNIIGMLTYKPIWQEYFYQALKELYIDNVRYLEFRGVLPTIYDLNGKVYNQLEVVGLYHETLMQFKHDHPEFWGARFIYAPFRRVSNETMDQYVRIFTELKKNYPDFVAGFDLVGQEDLGQPLEAFITQLLDMKANGTKFFFHAGETNWCGCTTDHNLFDAVLLNSVRIGHGFAIPKHPALAKIVNHKKIAIEVSPISNQVLKLVEDIRNHPAATMIAQNYPLVITCDDPSFWGAKGLSYDWYVAFMALASKEADLRFLKQLALNSIIYSSMEPNEKSINVKKWEKDWDNFINNLLRECNVV